MSTTAPLLPNPAPTPSTTAHRVSAAALAVLGVSLGSIGVMVLLFLYGVAGLVAVDLGASPDVVDRVIAAFLLVDVAVLVNGAWKSWRRAGRA